MAPSGSEAVAVGEGEEVRELGFAIRDAIEGSGLPDGVAEGSPQAEDPVLGESGLTCGGASGNLESSAEVIEEEVCGVTWSRVQGWSCG